MRLVGSSILIVLVLGILSAAQAEPMACRIEVLYKQADGSTYRQTTCVPGGERYCDSGVGDYCGPENDPGIINRWCTKVPKC